jgi:hypothetical protein
MKTDEKMAKLDTLIAEIETNPMVLVARAEKAAANKAKRADAAGKIKAAERERAAVIPELQADIETKEGLYLKAKAAVDDATNQWRTAKATLTSQNHQFEMTINRATDILIDTADPAIDEAIQFFRDKLDWLRAPGRISHAAVGSGRNLFTMTKTTRSESNVASIHAAMQYCQTAIKELLEMKLTPAVDLKQIERLKAKIPDTGKYIETTGEHPIEKAPPPVAF